MRFGYFKFSDLAWNWGAALMNSWILLEFEIKCEKSWILLDGVKSPMEDSPKDFKNAYDRSTGYNGTFVVQWIYTQLIEVNVMIGVKIPPLLTQ